VNSPITYWRPDLPGPGTSLGGRLDGLRRSWRNRSSDRVANNLAAHGPVELVLKLSHQILELRVLRRENHTYLSNSLQDQLVLRCLISTTNGLINIY